MNFEGLTSTAESQEHHPRETHGYNALYQHKKRRLRTNFTEFQNLELEDAFAHSHYPDKNAKREIASRLQVSEDRIMVI